MLAGPDFDVLVVVEDATLRAAIVRLARQRGGRVDETLGEPDALDLLRRRHYDAALVDLAHPRLGGMALLQRLRAASPECEVVVLVETGAAETAVEALQMGASAFATTAATAAEVDLLLHQAVRRARLAQENRRLHAALRQAPSTDDRLGDSPTMQTVRRFIEQAATSDFNVLFEGEVGASNEAAARALHRSVGAGVPLIKVDCDAVADSQLDVVLFGGAEPGLIEIADGGLLLLAEVAALPAGLQDKLLRVFDERRVCRNGSTCERRANVRFISTSSRDLRTLVDAGRFREDLFQRLSGLSLKLPHVVEVPPAAVSQPGSADGRHTDALAAVQRSHIVDILRRERGNKARTARALGINRRSLYRLLDKHRISATESTGLSPGDSNPA